MRFGPTFRSGRMRRADGPSSGSETLSRIRSLADYTIAMLESSFRKRHDSFRQAAEQPPLGVGKASAPAGRLSLGQLGHDRPHPNRLAEGGELRGMRMKVRELLACRYLSFLSLMSGIEFPTIWPVPARSVLP
jgi:hypothetical protein